VCCSPRATKDAVATKCFGGFSIISILKIGVYGKWAQRRSSPHRRFRTPLLLRLDRPLGVHAVFLPGWWATIPRTLEHSMSWTAHYFDRRLNSEGVSRACASKEDALRLACDLIHRKCIVRFITGPNDEKIDATEITSWCRRHPTRERPAPPK
jgi:hypothetical protein